MSQTDKGDPELEPETAAEPETNTAIAAGESAEEAPPDPAASAPAGGDEGTRPAEFDADALGRLANLLLGNPAVSAAFDRAIDQLRNDWQDTVPTDTAAREAIYFRVKAVEDLRRQLSRLDASGRKERSRLSRGLKVA